MTDIELLKFYKNEIEKTCKIDVDSTSIEEERNLRKELYGKRIQAFENAISALEKQIPKKVEIYDDDCRADCPVCGREFENNVNDWGCQHCQDCGQALDWGDSE